MSARIEWHGDELSKRLEQRLHQALQRSAVMLTTRARILASTPAKRIRRKRTRTTSAGKRGGQYTDYVPSAPGSPPAVRTGFGRRNITYEYDPEKFIARVGVRENADYMAFLEVGTRRIAPRPWLRPALRQTQTAIDTLIKTAVREASR